tara:strand:- start:4460 stop:5026 length:567 start_codon:yes stop_codon:yes gene_type:complete
MIKIGITGSLSSGKTTASKFLSNNRGPLFSADNFVKKLYNDINFKNLIAKKFKIKKNSNIKKILRGKIVSKEIKIRQIENIIHPIVRKGMNGFIKKNRKRKILFLEIPLLIENKLMKHFDVIIFIKTKKKIRLKRFLANGGNKKLFEILNKKQLRDSTKIKFCDHLVINDKNISILKKSLFSIIKHYE